MVEDQDEQPTAAGKAAAEQLKAAMGEVPLKAVIVSECFEDQENKQALLAGVCSVLPSDLVFGQATYGSFTQAGCGGFDTVCLLGIGGDGIGVSAALVKDLGVAKLTFEEHEAQIKQRLHAAGAKLAGKLARGESDRLAILMADAHSPKNQFLVEGVQQVLGGGFPITGGSANKNAGQTFVYYRGQTHSDSAIALMLSGDFRVTSGRPQSDGQRPGDRHGSRGGRAIAGRVGGQAASRAGLQLCRAARQIKASGRRTGSDPNRPGKGTAPVRLLLRRRSRAAGCRRERPQACSAAAAAGT